MRLDHTQPSICKIPVYGRHSTWFRQLFCLHHNTHVDQSSSHVPNIPRVVDGLQDLQKEILSAKYEVASNEFKIACMIHVDSRIPRVLYSLVFSTLPVCLSNGFIFEHSLEK